MSEAIETQALNTDAKANAPRGLVLAIGMLAFLLALLLHGRVDGSDTSHYLEAAKRLIMHHHIDGDSYFDNRLGMTLPLGVLAALFDWAPFAWTLFPALCYGLLCGASFYALRTWLPQFGRLRSCALVLLVPGALRAGAMLYPDVPQAAFLALGLVLLFRPERALPSRVAAIIAGLALGWMVAINPAALRFGVIVLILAGLWAWRGDATLRKALLLRALFAALGVAIVLGVLALAHSALAHDALLHYRQLRGGGIAAAPDGRIDGIGALLAWLRGGLGPFGEFGLMGVLAILGLCFAPKQLRSGGTSLALVWIGVVLASMVYALVPQMLAGRAGAGEMSTRYLLPATLPLLLLVAAFLQRVAPDKGWRAASLWAMIVLFFLLALLFNHKPRLLTVSSIESFEALRADPRPLYADPRLALWLSQEWGREVRPLGAIDAEGVALLSPRERSLLQRKYGPEVAPPMAMGYELGSEIDFPAKSLSLWQEVASWLEARKSGLSGANDAESIDRTRAYHVNKSND